MDRHEVVNSMWNAAKESIEELNGNDSTLASLSFFGLLDACKKKLPKIAIQAELESFNLGEALFYALLREWDMVHHYVDEFSDVAYHLLCHLLEEEDFTQVFPDMASMMYAVLSLHRSQLKYATSKEEDFYRLYNSIARRTLISLKS